jgi:hypothetical protein
MTALRVKPGEAVYSRAGDIVLFNQLAVKIEMDRVPNAAYFAWLDRITKEIAGNVSGAQIAEKEGARLSPPLNTAIYYDTPDYAILPTGSLLRTSCNTVTHAFCAFKLAQDAGSVRRDYRYVFEGEEKRTIQGAPASERAVAIVRKLLARTDVEHPGTLLRRHLGIDPTTLTPALGLDDLRYTFFVWLDGLDALRCSVDRASVFDLRIPEERRVRKEFSEVELAIYPHVSPEIAADRRLVQLIEVLSSDLRREFGVAVTTRIKYQRAARALRISPAAGV